MNGSRVTKGHIASVLQDGKNSGNGWLHKNMYVLNALSCILEMVAMVILYAYCHNKRKWGEKYV